MEGDDAVAEVLAHGDPAEQEALTSLARRLLEARVATSAEPTDLPGLPARPSAAGLSSALARNEERRWAARRALYDTALSYPQAADRLGVSTNQVSNLVSAGELLAVDGPHGKRLPAWQLNADTPRGRLDGIAQVAARYPGGVVGLSAWMTSVHPSLGGRTPAGALADGDLDEVVAAARVLP